MLHLSDAAMCQLYGELLLKRMLTWSGGEVGTTVLATLARFSPKTSQLLHCENIGTLIGRRACLVGSGSRDDGCAGDDGALLGEPISRQVLRCKRSSLK